MTRSGLIKIVAIVILVAAAAMIPMCKNGDGKEMSAEHKELIREFEGFREQQCACNDYACTQALGQKFGPKVAEVLGKADAYPTDVQLALTGILKEMTDCANRTKQP
jgi:hypothetical protein